MKYIFLLLLSFFSFQSFSQARTGKGKGYRHYKKLNGDYSKLDTIKYYDVSRSMHDSGNGKKYSINQKNVSREYYEKFAETSRARKECQPCILQTFTEDEILVSEEVALGYSTVGWFKKYHPNGKLKQTGYYVENPIPATPHRTWKWYVNDGTWTWYDLNGDTLYTETWKQGEFINQFPEQNITEPWKVDLHLKGDTGIIDKITADQVRDLQIKAKYKNSNRDSVSYVLQIMAYARNKYGNPGMSVKIPLDSLKHFDLNKELLSHYFLSTHEIGSNIWVYNNNKYLDLFHIKISNTLLPSNDIATRHATDSINKHYKAQRKHYKSLPLYTEFSLTHAADSSRKAKIVNQVAYELAFNEPSGDTMEYTKHFSSGFIRLINDSSLNFEMFSETIERRDTKGYYSRTESDYHIKDSTNGLEKSIPLKNLEHIRYKSNARENLSVIGGMIIFASAVTLITSPLIGINYIKGGFNKDRFRSFAIGGAIGVGVGIPFTMFGRPKTYKLSPKNEADKDYWTLKQSANRNTY
jgi:hypothetical protein